MEPSRTVGSLLILALLGCCYGDDYKRWVPNTNFETAGNWEGGSVPCANDHVKFPDTLGTVFIQTNTTITEMTLPMTGELLLGNYISISFPLEPAYAPGCPVGREVKFTRTEPKSWFDPTDWCVTATEAGDCRADQPALLASEKVPCNTDTVSYPMSSSFLVGLEYGTDVYAGSLIISGKSYSTATFKVYLDSEEGKRQFVRGSGSPATTVTLTGNKCTDVSGCACGNDRGSILEKICQTSVGQCADVLTCTHTIKPMGACCDICGAVMKLDIGSGFNKVNTENMILSKFVHGQDKYKNVKPIVSKTSLGQIQVVLTDGGDGQISAEVAFSLKKYFEDNSNYGVTGSSVDVSENVKPTPGGQTGQLEGGGIAGIVLGLILALVLIAIILYFVVGKRRRPSLPINLNFDSVKSTFVNLGKRKGPADLELGAVSFTNSPEVEDLSYGFDNPMYGDVGAVKEMSKMPTPGSVSAKLEPVSDAAAGFSNPLYGSGIQVDFENLGESKPKTKSKKSPKSSKPVEQLTFPDATAAGFSNPLYATPIQVVDNSQAPESPVRATTVDSSDNAILVLNPVFSTDGVEDSFI